MLPYEIEFSNEIKINFTIATLLSKLLSMELPHDGTDRVRIIKALDAVYTTSA